MAVAEFVTLSNACYAVKCDSCGKTTWKVCNPVILDLPFIFSAFWIFARGDSRPMITSGGSSCETDYYADTA